MNNIYKKPFIFQSFKIKRNDGLKYLRIFYPHTTI